LNPLHRLEADDQVRRTAKGVNDKQIAPDNCLDFNENVLRKPSNLDSRTGWLVVTKVLGIDGVDLLILGERCKEHLNTASVHLCHRRLVPRSEMVSVQWF
jgi:hypothetical protein